MPDAIVVFGCTVDADGRPSEALLRRLRMALSLAGWQPAAHLVLSGAAPPGRPSEAEAMRVWLHAAGIAAGRLICEPQALSTRDNARLCAEVLQPLRPRQVWLVTESFHMRRSLMLLRQALRRARLQPRLVGVAAADGEVAPPARLRRDAGEALKLCRDAVLGWA